MRIVYITPFFRIPPDFGLGIRNYAILKRLISRHEVTVVTAGMDETGETDHWLVTRGARVIRIPYRKPPPPGGHRFSALIKRVLRYPPGSFQRVDQGALDKVLKHLWSNHQPIDLFFFDTQLVGQALLKNPLLEPAVLSLADLYVKQRYRRLMVSGARPYTLIYLADLVKNAFYERRILSRYSAIITVSNEEYEIVKNRYSKSKVALIPNGVDTAHYTPVTTDDRGKNTDLLFVGSYDYAPNVDAFFYFYNHVFPLILMQKPDARFLVLGRKPTSEMLKIGQEHPAVCVTGAVPDVRPYYRRAAAVVVPLRIGSGTKLKILEAFAMGVPVVTTSVGCEGIHAEPGRDFLLADDALQFAEKAIRLLDNPMEGILLAERARCNVEENYDWQTITDRLEKFCLALID